MRERALTRRREQQTERAGPNGLLDRTPPHSVEAERGILGSMLQTHGGAEAIAEAVTQVRAEFFLNPVHRDIFTMIYDMHDAGSAIDLITVTNALRKRKLLDQVGGAQYVTELFTFVPTAANIDYYIDIVREKYVLRETCRAAEITIQQASNGQGEPSAMLDELESRIASIRSVQGKNGRMELTMPTAKEILTLPRDKRANFMGDYLLAKAQSLVMAGVGGLGKSLLVLQLLTAWIIGRAWFGIETHEKGQKSVLFQTENNNRRLQNDLEAIKKWAGKDWKLIEENLIIHTLETDADLLLHLSDPKNVEKLQRVVQKIDPAIVTFDVLRDFNIGDLSSDADMAATCREIGRVSHLGNPERAIIVLTHALTGRAGAAKAFGLERTGFGRNSKVLHSWSRAFINVIPGSEDSNDKLVVTCGKNNNGKEFEPFAIMRTPEGFFELDSDFDVEGWREHVTSTSKRRTFSPRIVIDIPWPKPEVEKKALVKLIKDETGCSPSQAYKMIDEAQQHHLVVRFNKTIRTYAKT